MVKDCLPGIAADEIRLMTEVSVALGQKIIFVTQSQHVIYVYIIIFIPMLSKCAGNMLRNGGTIGKYHMVAIFYHFDGFTRIYRSTLI